jgi:hypothetical protein
MTNNDMDKLCEGCCIHELRLEKSTIRLQCGGYISKDKNCPCQICLVKMMCVGICDKLRKRNWCGKVCYYKGIEL